MQVANINPLALPSVSLIERRQLPHCPAIYFVLEGDEVVYIRKNNSLLLRWQAHHKLKQSKYLKNAKIAWIEISDKSLL